MFWSPEVSGLPPLGFSTSGLSRGKMLCLALKAGEGHIAIM